jgi:transposase
MANHVEVAKVNSILVLHQRGWSSRRIAAALGVHRETVLRYVRLSRDDPKPAKAPPGSDGSGCAVGIEAPLGSARLDGCEGNASGGSSGQAPGRAPGPDSAVGPGMEAAGSSSGCQPFRGRILAKLELGLSAKRIHQDLEAEQGKQAPSYYSVRRFAARLKGSGSSPFRRMECEPGVECQVDFGKGAPVQPAADKSGKRPRRRRPHVLRVVLSHSRKAYSEAVWRQTTEEFIRCIENAFWHFGGVPQTLVLDNLRAAVSKADWFDPEINPKVQSFCEYYGIVPLPTKPYTPRHKGKVERGVEYVQSNGLKGHVFASIEEQNDHLLRWEASVADTRIHGTTRKQVGKVFEEVERQALGPLPASGGRFPFFHESERTVHRDGHVEVDKAYYSVPPEHLGRRVWVRWDSRTVRVFSRFGDAVSGEPIALHVKREPGRFSTQPRHIASDKISCVEYGAAWLLSRVSLIGPHAGRWGESMMQARGVQGVRVLQGLISLTQRHRAAAIEQACQIAQTHGAYRLRTIRQLIKRAEPKQEQFEFVTEHPIIRGLDEYEQLVHTSIQRSHENERRIADDLEKAPTVWPGAVAGRAFAGGGRT